MGGYLVPEGGVPGLGGAPGLRGVPALGRGTWSLGGVPGPRGMYLVPGGGPYLLPGMYLILGGVPGRGGYLPRYSPL